jgi:hypothetical protein
MSGKPYLYLVPMALCLTGCSNLATQKVDATDRAASKDIGGVPFTLNKPQFTVTRTPGSSGAADTYQLRVDYVPDPTQSYVVQLHPNFNVGVDWTVTLDDGGSLSDSNAKLTDQSVAVLSSVAKLAAAAFLLDKYDQPEHQQVAMIDSTLTTDLQGRSPQIYDRTAGGLRSISQAEAARLLERWRQLKVLFDSLAAENQLASYTYGNETDREILDTALHLMPPTTSTLITGAIGAGDPDLAALAQQARHSLERIDRQALTKMKADLVKKRAQIYAQITTIAPSQASQTALDQNKKALGLVADALKHVNEPPRGLLLDLTDLSSTEWQRRTIATLNKQIDLRRSIIRDGGVTVAGDVETNDGPLRQLLLRKASVLGLVPEFTQLASLRAASTTDPEKYAKAQASVATLQKELSDAETALTPVAPTTKPDDPSVAALVVNQQAAPVTQEFIRAKLNDRGIPGRPAYVVVLQPALPQQTPPTPAADADAKPPVPQPIPSQPPPAVIPGQPDSAAGALGLPPAPELQPTVEAPKP